VVARKKQSRIRGSDENPLEEVARRTLAIAAMKAAGLSWKRLNGKQYVMVFTGEGQSVTAGPLGLTRNSMPPAVRGHNSIFAFALP